VTEQAAEDQIDWSEVVRRARAREPRLAVALAAVTAGWAGASDRLVGAAGTAKWIVVAVYVLFFVALLVTQRLHPRMRARAGEGYRVQYALREHVDPGPGLREKVDRQAAHLTRIVWFRWWLLLFIPTGVLVAAPWDDQPLIVVPSALVLVAGVVAWARSSRRLCAAARRWVADPPGPPREMPAPNRWERWISGWQFLWLFLFLLVAATGVAVVPSLVNR
jgi:hypothetical protein